MVKKGEQDEFNELFGHLFENGEFVGLKEPIVTILFKCIDCGTEDEVPDFVVDEFSFDLEEGEEVETVCPACGGTMRKAKTNPK
ncbi:MAG: hypothetical protein ACI35P_14640 [Bacillus sp. (in: firmicutes)]